MESELLEMLKAVLQDGELIKLIAKAHWTMYSALKEEGFTDEQALQIVIHQGNGMNSK